MGRVTEPEARQIIRELCAQFIEDEPARSENEFDLDRGRSLINLELDISAKLGHVIRPGSLDEALTTLGEIQSVECGTHPDLIQNQALTINTAPDILDTLERQLKEDVYFVLQAAGFTARRYAA
jgi:hypothetical protein